MGGRRSYVTRAARIARMFDSAKRRNFWASRERDNPKRVRRYSTRSGTVGKTSRETMPSRSRERSTSVSTFEFTPKNRTIHADPVRFTKSGPALTEVALQRKTKASIEDSRTAIDDPSLWNMRDQLGCCSPFGQTSSHTLTIPVSLLRQCLESWVKQFDQGQVVSQ